MAMTETFCATQQVRVLTRQRLATSRNRVLRGPGATPAAKRTQQLHAPPSHHHPPLLNLPPEAFLLDLTDHYLFAALHQMLYTSLMQENRRRMNHLEGAVRHLDEESSDLARQCNALRQEEIIEEIEVILLSAASINGGSSSTSPRT